MKLQEYFDNINKKQKFLLYSAAVLTFIFSLILIEENEDTLGITILFLDFIYLNVITISRIKAFSH